jgi:hypothetical protein
MESNLFGLDYFEFIEMTRSKLNKKVKVLSNKTIQETSRIDQEIKKTGIKIYCTAPINVPIKNSVLYMI